MYHDTLVLQILAERERSAYTAGDSEKADLYALLIDLSKDSEEIQDIISADLLIK
jgi:hypothetical protein